MKTIISRTETINILSPYIRVLLSKTHKKQLLKISIYLSLAAILAVGLYLRFDGLKTHVTYIDELMILTEGDWNSRKKEKSYSSDSPIEFAIKISEKKGVSYAPLQFILTYYFIKDITPLSYDGLHAARIPSAIFGFFSLIVFLLLMWKINNKKLSVAFLFPLTLLAVSQLAVINSQQAHTYSIGLWASFLIIMLLIFLAQSQKIWQIAILSTLLGLLPSANYLIIPVLLASTGVLILFLFFKSHQNNDWKLTSYKLAFLGVPVLSCAYFSYWVMSTNRAGASIPWWVKSFSLKDKDDISMTELFKFIGSNLKNIVETLLINSGATAYNTLALYSSVSFILIAATLYIYGRKRFAHPILPLLLITSSLIALLVLVLFKSIALSPSRHSLVFFPILLLPIYYSLLKIEQVVFRLKDCRYAFNTVIIGLSFILLYSAIKNHNVTKDVKKETLSSEIILKASKDHGIKTVVTDWHTYNRLYLLLEDSIESGQIKLRTAGEEKKFPKPPFLLVGVNVQSQKIYKFRRYRHHKPTILFEKWNDYDFEPSPLINYWPNRMAMYLIEKK